MIINNSIYRHNNIFLKSSLQWSLKLCEQCFVFESWNNIGSNSFKIYNSLCQTLMVETASDNLWYNKINIKAMSPTLNYSFWKFISCKNEACYIVVLYVLCYRLFRAFQNMHTVKILIYVVFYGFMFTIKFTNKVNLK